MSETQPDLREALARDREAEALQCSLICVEQFLIEADFDAAVSAVKAARDRLSALQAEVEAARALNRDLHRRAQKAESFRARHGNTYGVKARWAGRQALRKALAEVERLQKVEGEREKGRVPDGTGLSPDGQTASRSDPSDFDPSRGPLADFARQMIRHAWNGGDVDGGTIQDTAASLGLLREEPYDPKKHGGTTLCEIGDTWFVFAGPLASASDEHPAGEDAKRLSGEAMPARSASADAPSDNPLAETKEGSELNIFPAS